MAARVIALMLAAGFLSLGYAGGFSMGFASGQFGGGQAFGGWGAGHSVGTFNAQRSAGSFGGSRAGRSIGEFSAGPSRAVPHGGRSFGGFDSSRHGAGLNVQSSFAPIERAVGVRGGVRSSDAPGVGYPIRSPQADQVSGDARAGRSFRGSGGERFSGSFRDMRARRSPAVSVPHGGSAVGPSLEMPGRAEPSPALGAGRFPGSSSPELLGRGNVREFAGAPEATNTTTFTGQGAAAVPGRRGNTVIYRWTDDSGTIHFADRRPATGRGVDAEVVSGLAPSATGGMVQRGSVHPRKQRTAQSDMDTAGVGSSGSERRFRAGRPRGEVAAVHGRRHADDKHGFGQARFHHHHRFHGPGAFLAYGFFSPFLYSGFPYYFYWTDTYADYCDPDSPDYDPTRLVPYDDRLICCDPDSRYYDPAHCDLVIDP
jgi:Domain of unknown function (DUF4124)